MYPFNVRTGFAAPRFRDLTAQIPRPVQTVSMGPSVSAVWRKAEWEQSAETIGLLQLGEEFRSNKYLELLRRLLATPWSTPNGFVTICLVRLC